MIKSPILWAAGLALALGGAVAGNALGSTPILDRSALAAFYQDHAEAYTNTPENEPLPDHYPLVTREGTVPVAALSDRGLYSQRRYRTVALAAHYTPADAEALSSYDSSPVPYDRQGENIARGEAAQPRVALATEQPTAPVPLALDEPATIRGSGNAKTVKVSLALAQD